MTSMSVPCSPGTTSARVSGDPLIILSPNTQTGCLSPSLLKVTQHLPNLTLTEPRVTSTDTDWARLRHHWAIIGPDCAIICAPIETYILQQRSGRREGRTPQDRAHESTYPSIYLSLSRPKNVKLIVCVGLF